MTPEPPDVTTGVFTVGWWVPAVVPPGSVVTVLVAGGTAANPQKPTLNTPVTTSGGSGVTVTTGPGGVKVYHYRGDN